MNSQIGNDENNNSGLHNTPNANSEYLSDFSLEYSISWLNSKEKKM